MTIKLTVNRFRTRRPDPVVAPPPLPPQRPAARPGVVGDDAFMPGPNDDGFGQQSFATATGPQDSAPAGPPPGSGSPDTAPLEIDAIRREGLTGRQLRMARRLAQKHELPATSDFDAVRLLRAKGIDPFQINSVLELVSSNAAQGEGGSRALTVTPGGTGIQLPQTMKPAQLPSTELRAEQAHIAEITRIQQDIARRRRRRSILLAARLGVFVLLPAFLAGLYFYTIATPIFATKSEFVIQQAQAPAAVGAGSLFSNTPMATAQDSIAVQGYLQSQAAMQRLDQDMAFREHFSGPSIDALQRIEADGTEAAAFRLYKKMVRIAYDPTEGVIKLEVKAADPAVAVAFSKALIGYAEEQVDHMTQRMREDQMQGARQSYEDAELKYQEANQRVVDLQEKFKVLSSESELALLTNQIGQLETQLTLDQLSLAQMESNPTPNKARMEPLKLRIDTLMSQIADLRARMTEEDKDGLSLARVQSDLLVAQTDAQTRQILLAQSLQAMETARVEANRQTRFLSVGVPPIAPDEAAYPRAFENTIVALLIFAGVYLMVSMTIAILREQVSG